MSIIGPQKGFVGQLLRRGLREPARLVRWHTRGDLRMLLNLALTRDYTEANRRRMNRRISRDPKGAIGGWEAGIGELQFDFLRRQGLQRDSTLLDIGCGTLRGGRYFIDYLDAANYIGMDISPEALRVSKEYVDEHGLADQHPRFIMNDDLRFDEVPGGVDFAIAQSVFTHLPEASIRECFAHIGDILSETGKLYATFHESDTDLEVGGPSSYHYAPEMLTRLAEDHGLTATALPRSEYQHPRGQRMLAVAAEG